MRHAIHRHLTLNVSECNSDFATAARAAILRSPPCDIIVCQCRDILAANQRCADSKNVDPLRMNAVCGKINMWF